jgi:hypothetical protein
MKRVAGFPLFFILLLLTACNANNPQPTIDYRDDFIGVWRFNGQRETLNEDQSGNELYNLYPIDNYWGIISKSETDEERIVIGYLDGHTQEFKIDTNGVIYSSSNLQLGSITNQNALSLSWQTSSQGLYGISIVQVAFTGEKQ